MFITLRLEGDLPRAMAKTGEVVLSATERMLVEKQKMEIKRMRMSKVILSVPI